MVAPKPVDDLASDVCEFSPKQKTLLAAEDEVKFGCEEPNANLFNTEDPKDGTDDWDEIWLFAKLEVVEQSAAELVDALWLELNGVPNKNSDLVLVSETDVGFNVPNSNFGAADWLETGVKSKPLELSVFVAVGCCLLTKVDEFKNKESPLTKPFAKVVGVFVVEPIPNWNTVDTGASVIACRFLPKVKTESVGDSDWIEETFSDPDCDISNGVVEMEEIEFSVEFSISDFPDENASETSVAEDALDIGFLNAVFKQEAVPSLSIVVEGVWYSDVLAMKVVTDGAGIEDFGKLLAELTVTVLVELDATGFGKPNVNKEGPVKGVKWNANLVWIVLLVEDSTAETELDPEFCGFEVEQQGHLFLSLPLLTMHVGHSHWAFGFDLAPFGFGVWQQAHVALSVSLNTMQHGHSHVADLSGMVVSLRDSFVQAPEVDWFDINLESVKITLSDWVTLDAIHTGHSLWLNEELEIVASVEYEVETEVELLDTSIPVVTGTVSSLMRGILQAEHACLVCGFSKRHVSQRQLFDKSKVGRSVFDSVTEKQIRENREGR